MTRSRVGRPLALLLACTVLTPITTFPPPAMAQEVASRQAFDIGARPLNEALNALGRVTGLAIVFTEEVPPGTLSQPVSGSLTVSEALTRMLAGTPFTWRFSGPDTVTLLRRPAVRGAVELPEVAVSGAVPRSWSPVPGYVAEVSGAGTKTDTPIIETPQSISVITRDQLDAQRMGSLHDALRYTPGVTTAQGFNRTDETLVMRGFDAWAQTGSLYRDGLRYGANGYTLGILEPYALERIDILRGPASVLYGRSEPGGVIALTSKRPTDEPLHEIELSAGNYNARQIAGDFSGRLTEDGVWSYRLTGLLRDSDTMVNHVPDNRLYIAPALTWRPDGDTSVTFLAQASRNNSAYNYGVPMEFALNKPAVRSGTFIGEPGFDKTQSEVFSLGWQAEHRLDETWTLRQNTRWMRADTRLPFIAFNAPAGGTSYSRLAISRVTNSDEFAIDNQAEARFTTAGLRHTVLMGVDYSSLDLRDRRGLTTASDIDLFRPVYGERIAWPAYTLVNGRETSQQLGLYLQDQVRVGERLILLGGLRQDWVWAETEDRLGGTTLGQSDRALTWRAGAVYRLDGGFAPYATYARSFNPNSGVVDLSGRPFDPTTGQLYEVGLRWQPENRRSLISAALYQLTKQNVVTYDTLWTPRQIGETRSRGVEVEARAQLTEGLGLIATYTYTDAVITKSAGSDLGDTPPATPKHAASLWADYAFPAGPLEKLGLGGGVRYMGKTEDTSNSWRVPDYAVVDAMARYDVDAHWRLTLNAINLFDKKYVATCTYACFYGDRLAVTAALRYRW
ncbi:TonB-dependent siderophore receptor [Roseomonas sp. GC11]|uniref:TonB-dependent siderophore receptor n=1 Tax=Roseomonas sp. GC11 TaxID=2950546 RepID=UPI00210C5C0F|nr:TonB-dependent siderophore receptor [Roseomonas sp. GC11]MCQ4161668.1 TonB-dependent siderophore receptor [Roseomonas sp. GC11]